MNLDETFSPSPATHSPHHYVTSSAHRTSEGRVIYQRCRCGQWLIRRFPYAGPPVLEATVDRPGRTAAATALAEPAYALV